MAASVRPAGGEGGNHRRRNDDAQLPLHNDDDRRSGARVADGIDAGGAEAPPTLPLVRPLDRRQAANVVLAASADHLSSTNIAVAVTRLPLKPFSGFFPAFAEAASSAAKIAARTNPLLRAKVVSVPVMDGRLSPTAHSPVYRLFFADMDDTHAVTKGKLKANPEPQQQIPPFFRTLESQLDLVIGHELSAPFQLAHGPPARGVIITPPNSPRISHVDVVFTFSRAVFTEREAIQIVRSWSRLLLEDGASRAATPSAECEWRDLTGADLAARLAQFDAADTSRGGDEIFQPAPHLSDSNALVSSSEKEKDPLATRYPHGTRVVMTALTTAQSVEARRRANALRVPLEIFLAAAVAVAQAPFARNAPVLAKHNSQSPSLAASRSGSHPRSLTARPNLRASASAASLKPVAAQALPPSISATGLIRLTSAATTRPSSSRVMHSSLRVEPTPPADRDAAAGIHLFHETVLQSRALAAQQLAADTAAASAAAATPVPTSSSFAAGGKPTTLLGRLLAPRSLETSQGVGDPHPSPEALTAAQRAVVLRLDAVARGVAQVVEETGSLAAPAGAPAGPAGAATALLRAAAAGWSAAWAAPAPAQRRRRLPPCPDYVATLVSAGETLLWSPASEGWSDADGVVFIAGTAAPGGGVSVVLADVPAAESSIKGGMTVSIGLSRDGKAGIEDVREMLERFVVAFCGGKMSVFGG